MTDQAAVVRSNTLVLAVGMAALDEVGVVAIAVGAAALPLFAAIWVVCFLPVAGPVTAGHR